MKLARFVKEWKKEQVDESGDRWGRDWQGEGGGVGEVKKGKEWLAR